MKLRYEIWAAGKSQGHTTNPARLPMLTQRARDLNPGATPVSHHHRGEVMTVQDAFGLTSAALIIPWVIATIFAIVAGLFGWARFKAWLIAAVALSVLLFGSLIASAWSAVS
jgi:hypothetical protein